MIPNYGNTAGIVFVLIGKIFPIQGYTFIFLDFLPLCLHLCDKYLLFSNNIRNTGKLTTRLSVIKIKL